MDNKNNSILTFDTDEALYALITCNKKIWRIGNVIDMLNLKTHCDTSKLEELKKHKPFNVVNIDVENSFIKEAKH